MNPAMEPYELARRRFAQDDRGQPVMPPDPLPDEQRTWSGWSAFVPGKLDEVKARAAAVRIAFPADYIPVAGGVVIVAGFTDLEKIVQALRR